MNSYTTIRVLIAFVAIATIVQLRAANLLDSFVSVQPLRNDSQAIERMFGMREGYLNEASSTSTMESVGEFEYPPISFAKRVHFHKLFPCAYDLYAIVIPAQSNPSKHIWSPWSRTFWIVLGTVAALCALAVVCCYTIHRRKVAKRHLPGRLSLWCFAVIIANLSWLTSHRAGAGPITIDMLLRDAESGQVDQAHPDEAVVPDPSDPISPDVLEPIGMLRCGKVELVVSRFGARSKRTGVRAELSSHEVGKPAVAECFGLLHNELVSRFGAAPEVTLTGDLLAGEIRGACQARCWTNSRFALVLQISDDLSYNSVCLEMFDRSSGGLLWESDSAAEKRADEILNTSAGHLPEQFAAGADGEVEDALAAGQRAAPGMEVENHQLEIQLEAIKVSGTAATADSVPQIESWIVIGSVIALLSLMGIGPWKRDRGSTERELPP